MVVIVATHVYVLEEPGSILGRIISSVFHIKINVIDYFISSIPFLF